MIVLVTLVALAALAALVYVVRSLTAPLSGPTTVIDPVSPVALDPAEPGTIVVVLGNDAVAQTANTPDEHGVLAPRRASRPDLGRRHTTFGPFPADWTPAEMLKALAHGWDHHSDARPAWLESNDLAFAVLAAAELKCPVGCPADWKEAE